MSINILLIFILLHFFITLNILKMALRGVKVIEMMGLAPGPYCGMVLADFGANVTVIHKIEALPFDAMSNGKKMIAINLKTTEGRKIVKKLCDSADVLLDTYRPGVMEKLGLGPESLMTDNPKLIYARLTGYGQTGALAHRAGHDINYVAMSGILSLLAKNNQPPTPPLNLLADFGGGGLICTIGILLALFERTSSGKGQVIDVSMTEGAAYLASWIFKSKHLPIWSQEAGKNPLDGGAAFYGTYKTKDGKFMAVGAIEPQFYEQLLKGLGLESDEYSQFSDPDNCRQKFEEIFLTKTQKGWCEIFDKLDACVTPVLQFEDLNNYCIEPRKSFIKDVDGKIVPNVSPKLSHTPGSSASRLTLPSPGQHSIEVLEELGYSKSQIEDLIVNGHVFTQRRSNI